MQGYAEYTPCVLVSRVSVPSDQSDEAWTRVGGIYTFDISWATKITPEWLVQTMVAEQKALSEKFQALSELVAGKAPL